jgi:class 3 adenylate cyclase
MVGTRKIAAILVADVVGYSRLAAADEDRTLSRLRGLRSDLIDPAIDAHGGRIVKRTGDGSLIEFRSVVDAVRCAIEVQTGMVERNAGLPPKRRIEFRVGIHLGDVVEEADGDLMGDGVNIAARLEGIANPGAICLSEDAYRQVSGSSTWRSPTSARPNSRTSNGRSGSIRCKSAFQLKRNRRRRPSRPRNRRVVVPGGRRPHFRGRGGGASPHSSRGRLAFLAAPSRLRPRTRRQGIACGAAVCQHRRRRGDGEARRRTYGRHHPRPLALSKHGRHLPQLDRALQRQGGGRAAK